MEFPVLLTPLAVDGLKKDEKDTVSQSHKAAKSSANQGTIQCPFSTYRFRILFAEKVVEPTAAWLQVTQALEYTVEMAQESKLCANIGGRNFKH